MDPLVGITYSGQLERDGFLFVPSVLAAHEIALLLNAMDSDGGFRLGTGGKQFAIRNALDMAAISRLATDLRVRKLAESILGQECVAVRALVFDKVAGANWKVPFHQDLTKNSMRSWRERTKVASQLVQEWVGSKYGDPQSIRGRLRPIHERIISEDEEALYLGHLKLSEEDRKPKPASPQFE